MEQPSDSYSFSYRKKPYHGHFTPQNLVFNANLQDFSQRVGQISNLQSKGKLSAQEAYELIEVLWKQLEGSCYALGILPEDENN
ncbi:MAG: hypothetical protein KME25_18345 [Symplocastrum torsivum CPER-KK1]|jgi:hypothetical protein|uniref:Uncharacterized protein n=1 Tax=Symplocastrum torsivum CPER-KK1 TaxID=450513 RepID=A0A951PPI7_9CYAN|nr:hypothetical protein [Symplocastrum torsivum CPER-KK1]